MNKHLSDLEDVNPEPMKEPNLVSRSVETYANSSYWVKNTGLVKPGPLPDLPPSSKEWKASGKRGQPPVAYQTVIKDAPNNALEYELYHGFKVQVSPFEIEQRIKELEKDEKSTNQRYTRSAIYYLRKKLEELVVGS